MESLFTQVQTTLLKIITSATILTRTFIVLDHQQATHSQATLVIILSATAAAVVPVVVSRITQNFYNPLFLLIFMPYQCVHCGRIIDSSSREILEGCKNCGGKFFFYIRDEQFSQIKNSPPIIEFDKSNKKQVEADVREILGIKDEERPVILDLESVRVVKPGKFEIDLVSLMNKKPIIFKLEEGKYIIDLESGLPRKDKDLE